MIIQWTTLFLPPPHPISVFLFCGFLNDILSRFGPMGAEPPFIGGNLVWAVIYKSETKWNYLMIVIL